MSEIQLRHALVGGRDVFQEWLDNLRDYRVRVAILRRLDRIAQGNFGDHLYCRDGVWEVRIDVGAGYRVYYGVRGRTVVILLCGGDKRTQSADISKAVSYWKQLVTEP